MTNDVEALDQLVEDGLATLIQSGLTLIGVVVILIVLDPHLALLTFVALPILAVGGVHLPDRLGRCLPAHAGEDRAITGYLQETLSGIRVVRAFGQEPQPHRPLRGAQRREPRRQHDDRQSQRRVLPAVELLSALVTVEILVVGGVEAINGHTSTGVVFAFIAALNNFFDPIQQLSQLYTTYQSGMAALDKIFGLLDEEPDLVDAPDAPSCRRSAASSPVEESHSATAPGRRGRWALRDIDIVVPAGADGRPGG